MIDRVIHGAASPGSKDAPAETPGITMHVQGQQLVLVQPSGPVTIYWTEAGPSVQTAKQATSGGHGDAG